MRRREVNAALAVTAPGAAMSGSSTVRSHAASLALPAVRDAIGRGRPLIARFGERVETAPAGGIGLAGAP